MLTLLILSISVLLQLLAAVFALRLIHITGNRLAWLALAGAIFLMALRRAMTLGNLLTSYPNNLPLFKTELVALIISILVLSAVIMIKPLFKSIRRSEQELFAEKERAMVTLQSIGDGVVSIDTDGKVQYMNPVAELLCGVALPEVFGKEHARVLVFIDEQSSAKLPDPVERCLASQAGYKLDDKTLLINQRDGSEHSVEVMVSPILNRATEVTGAVLVLHDITELKGMARQLSYQATHDALTGLINRQEFERQLEALLSDAQHHDQQHAMCYLDMDDFKIVNDTCGHIAGDEMLKSVAGLLKKNIRETDVLARLGGDEFGILFESCPAEQVSMVVEKIRLAVSDFSFVWNENVFNASISIGVVPIHPDSGTITDVLSSVDSACYVAKERGRNCIHVFSEDDSAVAMRHGQMQWVQRVQRALSENRFVLYSQRICPIDNRNGTMDYAEVLLRMYNEQGSLIKPASFLPAAERYHLMPMIDRWVVENVFRNTSDQQLESDNIAMLTINLSGQTLGDESFLDYVLQQFATYTVSPERICFEITETAVISNIVFARQFISVLRDKGCRFALDDFGSGLSSFSYLKTLSVDYLKIDGNFVSSLLTDQNDFNLVISINQIGHVMGIRTIAEFVEDEATLDALNSIGVDYAQGYSIAMPVRMEIAESLLS